ncbi:Hypoxia up-regulated protein 1 [Apophysomyces ossiformis]|uniref:Hypoxia up-regulated protein 1 n=1 Tax=Apophysomyces ossiformis TaxID=679940 RepID=A0A8H7BYA4_9FUNG|nr:Hypoxia up-regulated protein 1 [Apophysomyces ossiformis]
MLARWLCGFLFAYVFVATNIYRGAEAAVMSIDYGTEWFKVGLIKPGIPLDVALNKDSKRKTQAVVTIRDNERIYGSDAVSLAGRFPHLTYFNLKTLLGKPYNDKHAIEYRQLFVNNMVADPRRNTPLFRHNDTTDLSVEELIAYQFQNARAQAVSTAGEDVKDVVITVTPFMTQYERQAILDAAELAGLNVLSLIHDETAVALNYAINRQFTKTPEYHIFYDMGAGSTVASVVSFSTAEVKEGKKTHSAPQLEVKSVGFDRTLGGHEFDIRLLKHLADGFMKKHGNAVKTNIYDSAIAMTRLMKEANRVKMILSANTETTASVESLHEGIDFRTKVTRAELESMSKDLLDRVEGPIQSALKAANMKVEDIKSLVLVGGSVRIPSVQSKLSAVMGAQKIAKNVNGDEAAVLGAAFRGASLSNQFRLTKQIKIKDLTIFPVEVSYEAELDENEKKSTKVTLFNEFGSIGTRKIMSFKRQTDFEFDMTYGKTAEEQDKEIGLDKIANVKVSGLTAALEKYPPSVRAADKAPKVRVSIEMSESGILSVPEAFVTIETNEPEKTTFTDKVKSFFGSKEEKSESSTSNENTTGDQQNQTDSTAADSQNTTTESDADTKEKKSTLVKLPLEVTFIPTGATPMSSEEKVEVKQRIKDLDMLDKKRRLREESRNALESFVYRVQDFLYDSTVELVSTEEERTTLQEQLSETSDWLYDEGEHAETAAYIERLAKLQSLEKPITYRRSEHLKRDSVLQTLDNSIQKARDFVDSMFALGEERYHTEEELNGLLELTKIVEEWKVEKITAQSKIPSHADPVLISADIEKKTEQVQDGLAKLKRKKKPKVVPKKEEGDAKNDTKADNEPTKNESAKNEPATEEKPATEGEHPHDEL